MNSQKNGSKVSTAAKTAAVTAKTATTVKQETVLKPVDKAGEVKQETLVFETTKPVEKKVTETKTTEKKAAEKKTAAKKPGRKPGKKNAAKAEKVEEIYVQFANQEILTKEVLERAKQAYISEGHRESSIKSIRLYIKPEEHMAYYVINEKIAGGVPV